MVEQERIIKHPCERCRHTGDEHRFDDDRLPEMEEKGTPWEDRPFRCLGPGLDGCEVHCPDFVGNPITIVTHQ